MAVVGAVIAVGVVGAVGAVIAMGTMSTMGTVAAVGRAVHVVIHLVHGVELGRPAKGSRKCRTKARSIRGLRSGSSEGEAQATSEIREGSGASLFARPGARMRSGFREWW